VATVRERWFGLLARFVRPGRQSPERGGAGSHLLGRDAPERPRRTTSTGLVVGIVLACLAAGAVGLAWQDRTVLSAEELPCTVLVVILLAMFGAGLVWLVLLIIFGRGGGKAPPIKRKQPSLLVMAVQLLMIVVLVLVLWRLRDDMSGAPRGELPIGEPTPGGTPGVDGNSGAPVEPTWSWPVAIGAGVVLALVVAAVGLVTRRATTARTTEVVDEAPSATDVAEVVAAGRAALGELDEPRAAVIRSYAAMETALGELGMQRRGADTPTELLQRAASARLFSPTGAAAATELAGLFERARFSRRALPPDARLQAAAAFNRLDAELRASARAQAAARAGQGEGSTAG
jgi:Domain of unknown function (DUF4129)